MSGLKALRDAVKGLSGPLAKTRPFSQWEPWWKLTEFLSDADAENLLSALTGSLDAAERFRVAVLPNSAFTVTNVGDGRLHATIWPKRGLAFHTGSHPSEPIARVLAVLEALIAKETP